MNLSDIGTGEPPSQRRIALRSSLEGTATFKTPSRHTWPSRITSAEPLSHASDSALDLSLYRSMSVANGAAWSLETAQTSPTITTTEVVAKDVEFGGSGGEQRGSIREHRRALCRGTQPALGARHPIEAHPERDVYRLGLCGGPGPGARLE